MRDVLIWIPTHRMRGTDQAEGGRRSGSAGHHGGSKSRRTCHRSHRRAAKGQVCHGCGSWQLGSFWIIWAATEHSEGKGSQSSKAATTARTSRAGAVVITELLPLRVFGVSVCRAHKRIERMSLTRACSSHLPRRPRCFYTACIVPVYRELQGSTSMTSSDASRSRACHHTEESIKWRRHLEPLEQGAVENTECSA